MAGSLGAARSAPPKRSTTAAGAALGA